jgi:hypothetical protein
MTKKLPKSLPVVGVDLVTVESLQQPNIIMPTGLKGDGSEGATVLHIYYVGNRTYVLSIGEAFSNAEPWMFRGTIDKDTVLAEYKEAIKEPGGQPGKYKP